MRGKAKELTENRVFEQIYGSIILPSAQKILGASDTKTTSIGLTNFLTKSKLMINDHFPDMWVATLTSQLKFLELPAVESKEKDDFIEVDLEDAGFQASFARLHTAARSVKDPWSSIPDPKQYLVDQLQQGDWEKFRSAIVSALPDAQAVLRSYGLSI